MIEAELRAALTAHLAPTRLEITDDSAAHAGHVGARSGAHFTVLVVADCFEKLSRVERHRLVYHSVADLMLGKIHALAIQALTPREAAQDPDPAPG